MTLDPLRFLLLSVAGWMNQQQQHLIEYLREENRVLRAQLGNRRLRFTDEQRRSLEVKARLGGRELPADVATIVTPETLLSWHRNLIAGKTAGPGAAPADRPRQRKTGIGVTFESRAHSRTWVISWCAERLRTF
jgi:putative transposase